MTAPLLPSTANRLESPDASSYSTLPPSGSLASTVPSATGAELPSRPGGSSKTYGVERNSGGPLRGGGGGGVPL